MVPSVISNRLRVGLRKDFEVDVPFHNCCYGYSRIIFARMISYLRRCFSGSLYNVQFVIFYDIVQSCVLFKLM